MAPEPANHRADYADLPATDLDWLGTGTIKLYNDSINPLCNTPEALWATCFGGVAGHLERY